MAEIKLRNINKEYILKRVEEEEALRDEIDDLEDTLRQPPAGEEAHHRRAGGGEEEVRRPPAHGHRLRPRGGGDPEEDETPDYPVHVFLSREGYFKKITPAVPADGGEQKYKEEDGPRQSFEATNRAEVMFFTDRCQVYKARLSDFDDTKASALGDYLPTKLGMEPEESVVFCTCPGTTAGTCCSSLKTARPPGWS